MNILIPLWFNGFDSVIYLISSMIGFMITFYLHKIYKFSGGKKQEYMYLGFLVLSLGLSVLAITSIYSYVNYRVCGAACSLGYVDENFSVEDFSYFMYFGFSLIAYTLFIFAYLDDTLKFSKIFITLFVAYLLLISVVLSIQRHYKVWYFYSEYFHLTSLVMIIYVSFKSFINFSNEKSAKSFLVMNSFLLMAVFHFLYLMSFVKELYVVAHFALIAGFLLLLIMVSTVRKK